MTNIMDVRSFRSFSLYIVQYSQNGDHALCVYTSYSNLSLCCRIESSTTTTSDLAHSPNRMKGLSSRRQWIPLQIRWHYSLLKKLPHWQIYAHLWKRGFPIIYLCTESLSAFFKALSDCQSSLYCVLHSNLL